MEKEHIMPFGKYKGKPITELSDGYLIELYLHNKLPRWLKEYAEQNINILKYTVKNNNSSKEPNTD